MHTDSKFGLLVGVILVVVVAVLFFSNEPARPPADPPRKTADVNTQPSAAALLPPATNDTGKQAAKEIKR